MRYFASYVKQHIPALLAFVLCAALYAVTFVFYRFPLKAVIYPTTLCLVLLLTFAAADIARTKKKHTELERIKGFDAKLADTFPEAGGIIERDYQEIIRLMREQHEAAEQKYEQNLRETMDYYTVWVHQIKTPIASMRLTLQNIDTAQSRQLQSELNVEVLTDEKWLAFVIEQVLSNALKYTPEGTVSVYLERPKTLCIRDTGIGIAPEDLPRVFENGYTGYNGRSDKKASGIGLYLCRRICNKLGHTISAESKAGEGTVIRIGLDKKKLEIE